MFLASPDAGAFKNLATIGYDDPLAHGLVNFWPLGEGGGRRFVDATGLNRTAQTVTGTPAWTGGRRGAALRFDGSTNVALGNPVPVTTGKISVACWVRPAVLTRGDVVTCWNFGGAGSQFDLLYGLDSGQAEFYVSDGTNGLSSQHGSATMVVGQWYHLCGTYDGATSSIYFNGRLDSATLVSLTLNSTSLVSVRLGNNDELDGAYTGALENVGIWNRDLKPSEVMALYSEAWRPAYVGPRTIIARTPGFAVSRDYGANPEWSSTCLRDAAGPVEWLTSRLRDAADQAEWRGAQAADAASPIGWRASLTRDVIAPVESGLSRGADGTSPASWRGAQAADAAVFAGWRAGLTPDAAASSEWGVGRSIDQVSPTDWRGAWCLDSAAPADWRGAWTTDRAIPVDPSSSPGLDRVAPADWREARITDATASVETTRAVPPTDAAAPVEWFVTTRLDATVPVDWRAGLTRDAAAPAGWRGAWVADAAAPVGWRLSLATDRPSDLDWRGAWVADAATPAGWQTGLDLRRVAPAEWGLLARRDDASTIGPGLTAARDDAALADWRATLSQDASAPADWRGAWATDAVAGVEWRAPAARDVVTFVSWRAPAAADATGQNETGTELRRDDAPAEAVLAGVRRDAAAGLDWLGPVAVTLDADAGVEWRASIGLAATSWGAWGAPVDGGASSPVSAGAAVLGVLGAPEATLSALRASVDAPAAWSGTLFGPADATASAEWRQTLVSDALGLASRRAAVGPIDHAAGTETASWRVLDDAGEAGWGGRTALEAVAPLESGGHAVSPVADADAWLEFGAVVAASVDAGASWFVRYEARHAKGAAVDAPAPAGARAYREGSGPKGAAVNVPPAPEPRTYHEGTGPKGATLER